ncbi:MAG TPA: Asp-tRNA(Asn)/Glu-tRNA(Gln) amidotransferase subunit GatC [Candidatus Paceibacterota bacterium]|nr:Asp-tRNA(Asn)/Glu-tRNA(Gln) amidotransferase subunit GatC [Candidatus Paceibacterota bacterium]
MSTTKATPEDVKRLAALARIEVPEEDLARFASEFDGILSYVGKLEELTLSETGRVLPPVRNVLREDGNVTEPGTWTAKITEQFPEREGDSLKVKQIISHD